MDDVQWNKYKDETLEFMLTEGKEMLNGVLESFRITANRVYALTAVYSSMIIFGFKDFNENVLGSLILIIGGSCCVYKVYGYLKTNRLRMKGTEPKKLTIKYFEKRRRAQKREMMIANIESIQKSIDWNLSAIKELNKNFNTSLKIFALTLLLFGCVRGWRLIVCLPVSTSIRSCFWV